MTMVGSGLVVVESSPVNDGGEWTRGRKVRQDVRSEQCRSSHSV